MKTQFYFLILIMCINFYNPNLSLSDAYEENKTKLNNQILNVTNFNITTGNVDYRLQQNGSYTCAFSIFLIINKKFNETNLKGDFIFQGRNLNNYELAFENTPLWFTETKEETQTELAFVINNSIAFKKEYQITGSYFGSFESKDDNLLKYTFAIDWGTSYVGHLSISVTSINQYHHPVYYNGSEPDIPPIDYVLSTKYSWERSFQRNFIIDFGIVLISNTPNDLLQISPEEIQISPGTDFVINVKNNGNFNLTCFIFTPERYILFLDIYNFTLGPQENINITIRVSQEAIQTNSTIEIIGIFPKVYVINVSIVPKESFSIYNVILFIFLLFSALIVFLLVYFKRKTIRIIMKQKFLLLFNSKLHLIPKRLEMTQDTYVNRTDARWNKLNKKWAPILPNNELKVIKFLFFENDVNQQAIADSLKISKMSISRIISRLEKKELLFREPDGFSNIIKLNYDRL